MSIWNPFLRQVMNTSLRLPIPRGRKRFAFLVGLCVNVCVSTKKTYVQRAFFSLYRTSYLPKPAYLWHIPLLTLASRTCFILWNRSLFLICSNSLVNFMLTANRTSMCLLLIRTSTESRESERMSVFWSERENGSEKGITKKLSVVSEKKCIRFSLSVRFDRIAHWSLLC